jgi:hypothetical protein
MLLAHWWVLKIVKILPHSKWREACERVLFYFQAQHFFLLLNAGVAAKPSQASSKIWCRLL